MLSEVARNQCRTAIQVVAEMLPNKHHPKTEVLEQTLRLISVSGEQGELARGLVTQFVRACPQQWGACRTNAYWRIMKQVGIDSSDAVCLYLGNFPKEVTERQFQSIARELFLRGYDREQVIHWITIAFVIRKNRGCRISAHSSTW